VQCESEDCPYEAGERYDTKEAIRAHNELARAIRARVSRARREALEEARGIAAVHGLALHAVGRTSDGERALDISDKIRALMEEEADDERD
jgi:hypothetical protein